MTYQSRPWQTHTAGQGARERNGVLGIEEQVDAMAPDRLGHGHLVPAQKGTCREGDLSHLRVVRRDSRCSEGFR